MDRLSAGSEPHGKLPCQTSKPPLWGRPADEACSPELALAEMVNTMKNVMVSAASCPLRTEDGPLDLAMLQRMVAESDAQAKCWSIIMDLTNVCTKVIQGANNDRRRFLHLAQQMEKVMRSSRPPPGLCSSEGRSLESSTCANHIRVCTDSAVQVPEDLTDLNVAPCQHSSNLITKSEVMEANACTLPSTDAQLIPAATLPLIDLMGTNPLKSPALQEANEETSEVLRLWQDPDYFMSLEGIQVEILKETEVKETGEAMLMSSDTLLAHAPTTEPQSDLTGTRSAVVPDVDDGLGVLKSPTVEQNADNKTPEALHLLSAPEDILSTAEIVIEHHHDEALQLNLCSPEEGLPTAGVPHSDQTWTSPSVVKGVDIGLVVLKPPVVHQNAGDKTPEALHHLSVPEDIVTAAEIPQGDLIRTQPDVVDCAGEGLKVPAAPENMGERPSGAVQVQQRKASMATDLGSKAKAKARKLKVNRQTSQPAPAHHPFRETVMSYCDFEFSPDEVIQLMEEGLLPRSQLCPPVFPIYEEQHQLIREVPRVEVQLLVHSVVKELWEMYNLGEGPQDLSGLPKPCPPEHFLESLRYGHHLSLDRRQSYCKETFELCWGIIKGIYPKKADTKSAWNKHPNFSKIKSLRDLQEYTTRKVFKLCETPTPKHMEKTQFHLVNEKTGVITLF